MKLLRAMFFWSHLAAGVLAGVVILIMSATGAALALKPQILDWIDRDVRTVAAVGSTRLPPSALIASAIGGRTDVTAASLTIDRDRASAASVVLGREGAVYVNPYSGVRLGSGSIAAQGFFRSIENWHRWLAMAGESRTTGRSVTGAANLAFFLLALSGLYLWWPRKWTPQHRAPILFFRKSRTGRARDFNWHNVIGFWCAPAIIVMTISGVVMSYPWANELLYRLTLSTPPAPAGGANRSGGGPNGSSARADAPAVTPAQIDAAWARAEQQLPTWQSITLRMPARPGAPATFSMSDEQSWNTFARSQMAFDLATGEVRQWQPYDASSLGQKARGWLRFAHTGELAGVAGQITAGIGCLGGIVLVWTGFALAFRRLVNWSVWSRTSAAAPAPATSLTDSWRASPEPE